MCATCGCEDDTGVRVHGPGGLAQDHGDGRPPGARHDHDAGHDHGTGHDHGSGHDHGTGHALDHAQDDDRASRTVLLQQKVLAKNDRLAERNRAWLRERGILAVNLMSSPGAGKTTLLERTAREAGADLGLAVIEGDQETTLDAGRIESAGAAVVQINTGAGCHLDAAMVAQGLRALDPRPGCVLVIENVGNLVCPALFDLGEQARVVIASVTEGADKPLKYPQMFRAADLVLLSKVDLLPYLDFDTARHAADLKSVSPRAEILPVSATTGEGVSAWYDWLRQRTPPAH
jgi:hydrogenase nickel incorporation protein HypB